MAELSGAIKIISAILLIFAITTISGCVQTADNTQAQNQSQNAIGGPNAGIPGQNGNSPPGMEPGAGAGPAFKTGYYDNNMTKNLTQELSLLPVGELTETEKSNIIYIAEEEKLACDTYLMYFDIWGKNIFLNIAGSKQWHIDAMELLINRYSLENPINDRRGVFTNTGLQNMYNKFVSSGSQSVEQALNNSIYIEETEISDLEEAIAGTDKPDLSLVCKNLLNASEKHMESFRLNRELVNLKRYMGPGPVILPPDEMNNQT